MNPFTTKNRTCKAAAILAFLCLSAFAVSTAQAQRRSGAIGLGGQIGEPSGITLKVYNPGAMSYDFLAAWDADDDFFFLNVHGVYERHLGNTQNAHFFFGPGVFVGFKDRPRDQDDDAVAGISGTFGLDVLIDQFEIYGQLTPRLAVIPETDGDIGGGIGFRFYF